MKQERTREARRWRSQLPPAVSHSTREVHQLTMARATLWCASPGSSVGPWSNGPRDKFSVLYSGWRDRAYGSRKLPGLQHRHRTFGTFFRFVSFAFVEPLTSRVCRVPETLLLGTPLRNISKRPQSQPAPRTLLSLRSVSPSGLGIAASQKKALVMQKRSEAPKMAMPTGLPSPCGWPQPPTCVGADSFLFR